MILLVRERIKRWFFPRRLDSSLSLPLLLREQVVGWGEGCRWVVLEEEEEVVVEETSSAKKRIEFK